MSVDDAPHHFLLPLPAQREFSYIEAIAHARSGWCPVTPGVSCPTSGQHFPIGGRTGGQIRGVHAMLRTCPCLVFPWSAAVR